MFDKVRQVANHLGYDVIKSAALEGWPTVDDHGEFMVVDLNTGAPHFGWNYDADIGEVWNWLTD